MSDFKNGKDKKEEILSLNPPPPNFTVVFSLIDNKIQKTGVEWWWENTQLWLDFHYN